MVAAGVTVVDVNVAAVVEIRENFLKILRSFAVQKSHFPCLEGFTKFAKFLEEKNKTTKIGLICYFFVSLFN